MLKETVDKFEEKMHAEMIFELPEFFQNQNKKLFCKRLSRGQTEDHKR